MDPRPLSAAVLLFGILVYVGAVAGLLFDEATPPGDAGALSLLVVCVLFGAYGFMLLKRTKVPT